MGQLSQEIKKLSAGSRLFSGFFHSLVQNSRNQSLTEQVRPGSRAALPSCGAGRTAGTQRLRPRAAPGESEKVGRVSECCLKSTQRIHTAMKCVRNGGVGGRVQFLCWTAGCPTSRSPVLQIWDHKTSRMCSHHGRNGFSPDKKGSFLFNLSWSRKVIV